MDRGKKAPTKWQSEKKKVHENETNRNINVQNWGIQAPALCPMTQLELSKYMFGCQAKWILVPKLIMNNWKWRSNKELLCFHSETIITPPPIQTCVNSVLLIYYYFLGRDLLLLENKIRTCANNKFGYFLQ